MKLLTYKEVKDLTAGPKSALDVSIVHWWQNKKTHICSLDADAAYSALCGLCRHYRWQAGKSKCSGCPLVNCEDKVETVWRKALNVVESQCLDNSSWKIAANNMFRALIRVSQYKNQKDFLARIPKKYHKFI